MDRLSFKSKKLPDIEVAQWSYDHSQEAGLGTMTLSAAKERMIPLLTRRRCWGVMALSPTGALTLENPDTKRLLDACAVQVAQTIERIEYSNIAKDAMIRGEAERMRATLLGAVSRDISLPVNSILKTTEKLLPELLGSPYSAAVSSIQGQAALLRRLTGNLKEMARLQAGNAELDLAQTDISQLITEAAGQFWSIDSGKTIQTDVSSDLPKVRIDRSLIMRALENLIDNAEKYSPKGTPVEISAQGKNHGVEIVCIAGIDGNGQTELVYGLTGLEPLVSGELFLCGQDITHTSIRKRSTMGMSHIPEDRHKHGLVLDYSLEDNMVLQRYFEPEFTDKAGFLRRKNIRGYAERLIEQYDVRSGQGPVTIARSMSGGNQQKAIVAREIDKDPEPSR